MDAQSLFAAANLHYVDEEYELALEHYTLALAASETPEYYSRRAACHLKLGKFAEALSDAERCGSNHIALHWKGVAFFYLSDFAKAKLAFEESLRVNANAKVNRSIWLRKCDAELSGSTLPLGGVVAEVSKVVSTSAATASTPAVISKSSADSSAKTSKSTQVVPDGTKVSAPSAAQIGATSAAVVGMDSTRINSEPVFVWTQEGANHVKSDGVWRLMLGQDVKQPEEGGIVEQETLKSLKLNEALSTALEKNWIVDKMKGASQVKAVDAPNSAVVPPALAASGSTGTSLGRKPIRREWYQNDSHVFITFFQKGLQAQDVKVSFQDKAFSVCLNLPGEEDTHTIDIELFDVIDPALSKVEVSKIKVEVALAKRVIGTQWRDLEKSARSQMMDAPASYPSSNKAKRDWSKVDKNMQDELDKERPAKTDFNDFLKQQYANADEDTRRAMMKSFQTSGGKHLDFNWDTVKKTDFEKQT